MGKIPILEWNDGPRDDHYVICEYCAWSGPRLEVKFKDVDEMLTEICPSCDRFDLLIFPRERCFGKEEYDKYGFKKKAVG